MIYFRKTHLKYILIFDFFLIIKLISLLKLHFKILDNVCYDCLGHAYFLEDGAEKYTVLEGNLGASTRKGSLIPSDQ